MRRLAKRAGVGVAGGLIVAVGIALLALPGPGWLVIFAGIAVWATEFDWAERLLQYARRQVGRWTQWVMHRPLWVRAAIGLAGLLIVAGIGVLAWLWYR
jgi:uncharacterized protein (TIGR02611 family)